ncbi:protoheme IX farnesyltransferase [mine drainage metagenome]|uniref:Protoheme IX farnesyltransferase n=1 Tax=mine drainage metagenome TaxID=410659 RepID=A0A1J5SYY6_9ZZZZ
MTTISIQPAMRQVSEYLALTKPRVIMLIVFCAFIGMLLAPTDRMTPGLVLAATLGITLVAAAAAALNCLIEQRIDSVMARTRARPLPRGALSGRATLIWSAGLCLAGMAILYYGVNALTAWLTLATFIGYAVIYTVILKPLTPQNIVIGGLSGAMPPVLGWAAMTGEVSGQAWLLALIIFVWTPPHFWALALYRSREYAAAGVPMLPVTHGSKFTGLHIFLYTWLLTAVTLMPFIIRMSGWFYLVPVLVLDGIFLAYAWLLWRDYSDRVARKTFRYSIFYLSALFSVLLIDHYL